MEDLVIITGQYVNIINLDKVRIKLELTSVERLKVGRNNGKDKMADMLVLQKVESRG